jgi:parallel beta-helix repeat protein
MLNRRSSCARITPAKIAPSGRGSQTGHQNPSRVAPPCHVDELESRVLLTAYVVSTTGSDAAAGTASAPWRTLQKAADSARAGDVVTVRAGTYSQGMNFFGKSGGTASAPITFTAEPGVTVTGIGLGTNASMAAINVESTGGWYVIQGFTVKGNSTMQRAGIRAALSPNTVIRNNNVSGAFDGIFASRSDGVVVENNVCANATDEHGIYVNGSRNYVIRGNDCYGNTWDGIHVNVSDGVNTINDGGLIEGNRVHGNALAGIDIDGATNLLVRNNVSYANWKHGITVYNANQNPVPPSANVTIVNNTLADNDMYGLQVQSGNAGGMTVFNNAITGNGSGSINMIGSLPSTFKSDYNVLSDKRTTGQDSHSLVASSSALFVNAGGGNYNLKSGVVAVDAGTPTLNGRPAPSIDFDKAARPQGNGYDVGADEVGSSTPPADTTPPTLSDVSASGVAQTVARIGWTTNDGATSRVEYGTSTAYGSQSTPDNSLATAHEVILGGLTAGMVYHFRVISTDAAGNTATSADFTFTTQPVDPPPTQPGADGLANAIAYDASGNMGLAYFDGATGNLKYATRSGAGTWSAVEVVDAGAGAGTLLSLAMDPTGRPGIAYLDSASADLKYAHFDGTTWDVQTVDARRSTGYYPSLRYTASGRPVISYYFKTGGDVRIAVGETSGWTIGTIDALGDVGRYSTLAVNPLTGRWSVAYEDTTRGWFRYAEQTRTGWASSVVDATTRSGGGYISLAFDPRTRLPAMSYYDAATADLKFAGFDGSRWSTQVVASRGAVGLYSNLRIDPGTGVAEILYYSRRANGAFLARAGAEGWLLSQAVSDGGRWLSTAVSADGTWTASWLGSSGITVGNF